MEKYTLLVHKGLNRVIRICKMINNIPSYFQSLLVQTIVHVFNLKYVIGVKTFCKRLKMLELQIMANCGTHIPTNSENEYAVSKKKQFVAAKTISQSF